MKSIVKKHSETVVGLGFRRQFVFALFLALIGTGWVPNLSIGQTWYPPGGPGSYNPGFGGGGWPPPPGPGIEEDGDPKNSLSISVEHAAGAQYRKIALNGRPMPDSKPQAEEETDEAPEETYIDAFDLNLRHTTSDIYVPLGGGDMSLAVKRDLKAEIFNTKGGFTPMDNFERYRNPFGVCWSTSVAPVIVFRERSDTAQPPYVAFSDYPSVTVSDENGASFKFGRYLRGASHEGTQSIAYTPFPHGKQDAKYYMNELTVIGGSPRIFKLEKKFGTTVYYEELPSTAINVPANRWDLDSAKWYRMWYARATKVVDRMGREIHYDYTGNNDEFPIIPTKIETISSQGLQTIQIERLHNEAPYLITAVYDPNGEPTRYEYTKTPFGMKVGSVEYTQIDWGNGPIDIHAWKLTKVIRPDLSEVKYGYNNLPEPEEEQRPPESPGSPVTHYQFNLESIETGTAATGASKYSFTYEKLDNDPLGEGAVFTRDNGILYPVAGLPRYVKKVTLPEKDSQQVDLTANFSIQVNETFSSLSINAQQAMEAGSGRVATVIDAAGHDRTYTFSGLHAIPISRQGTGSTDLSISLSISMLVYATTLTIDHDPGGPEVLNEVFVFDPDVGMALTSVTDVCGNETVFHYAESLGGIETLIPNFSELPFDLSSKLAIVYPDAFPDVTQEIDDLDRTKEFAYEGPFRIMSQIVDQHGTVTDYGIDPATGLRTWMKVTESGGTNLLRHEIYLYDDYVPDPNDPDAPDPPFDADETTEFPGFMARKIVKKFPDGVPDGAGGGVDLITEYQHDAYGNVWKEIVDPCRGSVPES